MSYRFLEHTADIQIECEGRTFEEIVTSATQAFYGVALREIRDISTVTRPILVEGATREDLLVRWLQELIFLLESEEFVAVTVRFEECVAGSIRADLGGYAGAGADRAVEVKAATYHELRVEETGAGLRARFVLDL